MKNVYKVNYTIFFFEDMDHVEGSTVVRACDEIAAGLKIEELFDTDETTARIDSVEFIA